MKALHDKSLATVMALESVKMAAGGVRSKPAAPSSPAWRHT